MFLNKIALSVLMKEKTKQRIFSILNFLKLIGIIFFGFVLFSITIFVIISIFTRGELFELSDTLNNLILIGIFLSLFFFSFISIKANASSVVDGVIGIIWLVGVALIGSVVVTSVLAVLFRGFF